MVTFNEIVEKIPSTYYFYTDEIDEIWHSKDDYKYYGDDREIDHLGFYNIVLRFTSNINLDIINIINTKTLSVDQLKNILICEYGNDSSFEIICDLYLLMTCEELF